MDDTEKQRMIDERNAIARQMADLRDQHEALEAKFAEFTEMCAVHSADRAAEQVAAENLVERLENTIREYKAEIARIEGV